MRGKKFLLCIACLCYSVFSLFKFFDLDVYGGWLYTGFRIDG
jgi:hypothetical protein